MHALQKQARADTPSGLTVEEFIAAYDYIVRAVILRYIPPSLGDVDDLTQEIWTQFIEGKNGTPYIQIYDPKKAKATTFMWEFTRTRCLQFLSRTQRTPTAKAFSIQNQPEDTFQIGIIDPETTKELGFDEFRQIEYQDLVDRATAAVHAHKIRGRRDLRWVWYLLREGLRQDEIAHAMELSEGTISICMDLIRQIPDVQELRQWAVENGLLHDLAYLQRL